MLSLRISNEEAELIKAYAKLKGMSVSELLRRSVIERIEDEYDLAVANEALAEHVKNGGKGTPISELWKELDL